MTTRENPLPLLIPVFLAAAAGTGLTLWGASEVIKANPPEIPEQTKRELEDAVSSGVSSAVVMSGLGVGLSVVVLLALRNKLRGK